MLKDSEEQFRNWDYFISLIKERKDIKEREKRKIIKGWGYLRDNLGKDWLKDKKNDAHPLWSFLSGEAPWRIRRVSELGFGIKALKDKPNFKEILDRLRSPEKFYDAYREFRVGLSLLKSGINFEFLKAKKGERTPDIKVISGQRPFYIEITRKNIPKEEAWARKNYNTIRKFLFLSSIKHGLGFCLDIQKPLTESQREEILKKAKKLMEEAKLSGFEHYCIPNKIDLVDLYVFKKDKRDRVFKEKGWRPDFDFDKEISRIRETIEEKVGQLENHSPGVLLIFHSSLLPSLSPLLWPSKDMKLFYKRLVEKLEEDVNKFPELSTLVVYIEKHIPDKETFEIVGKNYIAIKGIDSKLSRSKNRVIILNKFTGCLLSSAEVEILKTI